jgi:hypothetical protein
MTKNLIVAGVALAARGLVLGQVVSYEAISGFPEQEGTGWYQLPRPYQSDRWLADGWLVQYSEQVQNGQILEEEADSYRRDFPEQVGLPTWFLQFRVITDTPPVYEDVGPGAIAAAGHTGVEYHFVIGDSQIRFLRDSFLPLVYANIQPGVPHTFRLELSGTQSYTFWIDSVLIDSGVPEGPYPVSSSFVTFRGKASSPVNTTKWDYVRFGRIPTDYSGDFDSNGVIDETDIFFLVDCLLGPEVDASGPGCRWADMNADGVANGGDVQLFAHAMIGN